MAILEKEIWVTLSNNVNYYENLGYKIPRDRGKNGKLNVKRGTKILVKLEHLPLGSGVKLTKICDEPNCHKHVHNQPYSEILTQRREGDGKDRCFKCGNKRRANNKKETFTKDRVGTIRKNNFGSTMIVEIYKGSDDIWVKFDNGNLVHTSWDDFIKGKVANPYDRTLYGVGYMGEGKYRTFITDNNGKHKHTPQYVVWSGMLKRCYDEKYLNKYPTYIKAEVCEEWLNFQNFAAWYDENIYKVNDENIELDKDILIKRNKFYSPDTCIFVPQRINYLFLKTDANRGELPIGVFLNKKEGVYITHCHRGNGKRHVGRFKTPEDAFRAYKKVKEKYIKEIAEEYKDKIPLKLYEAMYAYKVEIND